MTDPIADMFTRIRNALLINASDVLVPKSLYKQSILNILKNNGFIEDFNIKKNNFVINLKYLDKKPAIIHLKKISKPGLRLYASWKNIPRPLSGLGTIIISTPKGVMTGKEARKKNLGGELICEIY